MPLDEACRTIIALTPKSPGFVCRVFTNRTHNIQARGTVPYDKPPSGAKGYSGLTPKDYWCSGTSKIRAALTVASVCSSEDPRPSSHAAEKYSVHRVSFIACVGTETATSARAKEAGGSG